MNIPMIAGPSSWSAFGVAFANHLWQSTQFAAVAGLLTLALRKNRAQARYCLWLITSIKFLVPFSLLVGLGNYLSPSRAVITQLKLSQVMLEMGQPFASANPSPVSSFTPVIRLLPTLLLIAWSCGCAAVLLFWWLRWRRMATALRKTSPIKSGRELEVLRRLEQRGRIAGKAGLLVCESTLEPGVLGIFRPILLLPAGIADRLTDAQLEAILTHELCHVRRRDNLAAVIHMLVEAIFWFHPLVWWIGARLVDERERACDEEVIRLGSEPQIYAEGILKVCEFYLESPLFCAAGVTGSNLKKRIEAIMVHHITHKLNLGKKLFLATAGIVAILGPIAIGFLNPTSGRAQDQPGVGAANAFESVSIKLSKITDARFFINTDTGNVEFTGISLKELIKYSYDLNDTQISGGDDWVSSQKYDISIKGPGKNSLNFIQIKLNVQKLLADRFKLRLRREVKELPIYELVVDKGGAKLTEIQVSNLVQSRMIINPPGHLVAKQVTLEGLVGVLSSSISHRVYDKTGLRGVYDFTLEWPATSPDVADSISAALREQLGLDLNARTGPVEMLVIDHAEEVAGPRD